MSEDGFRYLLEVSSQWRMPERITVIGRAPSLNWENWAIVPLQGVK